MPSINSVVKLLRKDYPEFIFESASTFAWSYKNKKITYVSKSLNEEWPLLFHELAHGLLAHDSFNHSIDLLQIERDAWDYAKILSNNYDLTISDEIIEQSLDTYRDWLHKRSSCPKCEAIGLETEHKEYFCPECGSSWRVNDARSCSLRRFKVNK